MWTTIINAQLAEFTFSKRFKKGTASVQLILIFGFKVKNFRKKIFEKIKDMYFIYI